MCFVPSHTTTLVASSHSDSGDKRPINEDRVLIKKYSISNEPWGMFLVADGLGSNHNKVASQMIVDHLSYWWDNDLATILSFPFQPDVVLSRLDEAIEKINEKVFSVESERKIGSTLSLLLMMGDRYAIRHVGDSRIYLLNRHTGIHQLTTDHSYVATQVAAGLMSEEEAKVHPRRNVITRCIGMKSTVVMFSKEGIAKKDDMFLLCTDGFHNLISDSVILDIVFSSELQISEKVQILRKCIKRGVAHDNVSLVLVGNNTLRGE